MRLSSQILSYLMNFYAMLTSSSSRCAMRPGIGIQLPAVGYRMSLLKSVKLFDTGEDNTAVSQVSKGDINMPRKSFTVLELYFYNAQKL